MRLKVLVGVMLLVPALGVAGFASTGASPIRPSRVLEVPGKICELSADGSRAAFYDCDEYELATWSASSGRKTVIEDQCITFCDGVATGSFGLAYVSYYAGNHPRTWQVWLLPAGRHEQIPLSRVTREWAPASNLAADGDLGVFKTGTEKKPKLWRIIGGRAALIRADANAADVVDVERGTIAVRRADGRIALLGENGSLIRVVPRISAGPNAIVQLDGQKLVLQREGAKQIQVYDVVRDRVLHRWHLRRAEGFEPYLEDARDGLAVYYSGEDERLTALHVLRLADGREAVIKLRRTPDEAVRSFTPDARLTDAGLFYLDVRRCPRECFGSPPTTLAFVPMRRLVDALR